MRKKLTLLFALLCVSLMGWATEYCNTTITANDGVTTVTLTCVQPTPGTYVMTIVGGANFGGFIGDGNYFELSGVGGNQVKNNTDEANRVCNFDAGSRTLTITMTADKAPKMYTPLYLDINGEKTFTTIQDQVFDWPTECASCTDVTGPTISAVEAGNITANSVELAVTASDNDGGTGIARYIVKNGDVQIATSTTSPISVSGLTSGTTYDNIKVIAIDGCDNESSAFSVASFKTEELIYYQFPTGHLGQANFADPNGRILLTLEKLSETSVKVLVEPNNPGTIVDYVFARVNGVEKTIGERSASSTENIGALTLDEVTLPDNFAVRIEWHTPSMGAEGTWTTNEFNVQKSQLYVEGASGAANPDLTLTNPTKSSILLPKGENITVTYTSKNEAAASIESSATGVASVSENVVTAEAEGTATITVSQAEVADTWQEASVAFEVNAFDWDNVAFIATSDYKFKASSNSVSLDNAILSRSGHNCIHLILPNAIELGCSLTGNHEFDGAGLFIYTDAFTIRQTPFTISCNGNVYDCYVYYNLDETAPVISDVQVTSHNYEQAIISITADEAFVSAEVFNNGVSMGSFTPSAGAITVTGLTAATKYDKLTVKVTDAAGNESEAANVPEFTTSDAPTISPATYYGYSTQKGVYALYSITRNPDMSVTFSAKVDAAFSFNKRLHYYKVGVKDEWVDLAYNSGTETYDYTVDAGLFIDGEEWVAEFYFPFTGDAASIVCNYTVGSEHAAPASIPAGAVVLDKTSNSLSVGETDDLAATVYPSFATNKTITWSSDDTDVASVENGTVTANAAGTAHITATCGEVSAQYTAMVTASLEEAKFYGCGAFVNNAGVVVSYDYVFTRATNHQVTLDVVFSRSMNGIIGNDNFQIYINSANQHMVYDDATQTATYVFGEQTESSSINYYFYFVLDGGGVHQIPQTAYIVGSTNDAAHAFAIGEKEDNVAALAAADGQTFDKVFVARSFAQDNLYTLVLPFDADAAQTAAKLPGQLTKLNNTIIKENDDLRLNFVDADAIEAGVPYLYQPSADVVNPVFEDVTVSKDLNPSASDANAKYYGIYAPTTGEELKTHDAYVLGSDQYLYAASVLRNDQPMNALRGYFVLNFPNSGANAPRARVIFNNKETEIATGISDVQSGNIQCTKVLRDGQLLIIRDGRTYDAQGQLIK